MEQTGIKLICQLCRRDYVNVDSKLLMGRSITVCRKCADEWNTPKNLQALCYEDNTKNAPEERE